MSGFLPPNFLIVCGFLLAKPTMFNTVLWQWINQSYMAGLNYANRNPASKFTNQDLAMGYAAAVGSSLTVAISLRMLTSGMIKGASGSKLLVLNTIVSAFAASSAGFCNTTFMRRAEVSTGIDVYTSPNLSSESKIGVSADCASRAVLETAISRVSLASVTICLPTVGILLLNRSAVIKRTLLRSPKLKLGTDFACVVASLAFGLPLAIGIFPPVS